jgi:hypothetical protein
MRPIRSDRIASSPPGNNLLRWLRSLRVLGTRIKILDIEMGGTSWLLLARAVAIVHPDRRAVGTRAPGGEPSGSPACRRSVP